MTETIFNIFEDPGYTLSPPPAPIWNPPKKVDADRLPMTGAELFGRQKELELLDDAWESEDIHVISLVTWGVVGKSTLVNKWGEKMARDNYRGASKVFAWSFYSQGGGERVTSANQFIREALEWFGAPDPNAGSSEWNKGKRLAELVQRKKALLIFDGLEPLQSPQDFNLGKLKDPALEILITRLARNNPGLCVITTRENLIDIAQFPTTTREVDLDQISHTIFPHVDYIHKASHVEFAIFPPIAGVKNFIVTDPAAIVLIRLFPWAAFVICNMHRLVSGGGSLMKFILSTETDKSIESHDGVPNIGGALARYVMV